MRDGRIFLKRRRDASFKKIYGMSLIWAGSILLDSTFKPATPNNLKYKYYIYHTYLWFYVSVMLREGRTFPIFSSSTNKKYTHLWETQVDSI